MTRAFHLIALATALLAASFATGTARAEYLKPYQRHQKQLRQLHHVSTTLLSRSPEGITFTDVQARLQLRPGGSPKIRDFTMSPPRAVATDAQAMLRFRQRNPQAPVFRTCIYDRRLNCLGVSVAFGVSLNPGATPYLETLVQAPLDEPALDILMVLQRKKANTSHGAQRLLHLLALRTSILLWQDADWLAMTEAEIRQMRRALTAHFAHLLADQLEPPARAGELGFHDLAVLFDATASRIPD